MEKGTGMLLIAGACVLVLLIGSIKPDGMDLELRYSHSYGWDRHLPDQFNAEKMGDRLSGRTWTGQPFDIWNPRIQRSFFALRSVSFSSFVSFC